MAYELAALGAALCWTFAALLAEDLSKQLGGITSILSSTQAVMMLPVIWWKTRQRPAPGAWLGAIRW